MAIYQFELPCDQGSPLHIAVGSQLALITLLPLARDIFKICCAGEKNDDLVSVLLWAPSLFFLVRYILMISSRQPFYEEYSF